MNLLLSILVPQAVLAGYAMSTCENVVVEGKRHEVQV